MIRERDKRDPAGIGTNVRLNTSKWTNFHCAVASALKLTIGIVTEEGELAALYNPPEPYPGFDTEPSFWDAYAGSFRELPRPVAGGTGRVLTGPSGQSLAVMLLDEGALIFFSGCSLTTASQEFFEKVTLAENLYQVLISYLKETGCSSRQALLSRALEEAKKLIASLLSPDYFDLKQVMSLVANSLVILLDAEGAWVFTARPCFQSAGVVSGDCRERLETMRHQWEVRVREKHIPDTLADYLDDFRDGQCGDQRLEGILTRNLDLTVCIGVVKPLEDGVRTVLSSMVSQMLIVLQRFSLAESIQQQLGILLSSINQGVIVASRQGEAFIINQAAAAILTTLGVDLSRYGQIRGCGLNKPMVKAIEDAGVNGVSYIKKQSIVESPNGPRIVNWDVTPLYKEGVLLGAILIFEDLTELVKLRRQVRDFENLAAVSEVAAGLAHEIRSPLAAASGALQLISLTDNQKKKDALLDMVQNELLRMNQILNDYLSIPLQGDSELLEPVCLAGLLQELEFLIRRETCLNEVDLVWRGLDCSLEPVMANADSLKQVFMNVAKNAIEAMPAGGSLEIGLSRIGDCVWVTFKDSGAGIPPENMRHILRPFFTTKVGGAGLGLAIAVQILKSMGGELKVESSPGQGTAVHVILPLLVS